MDVWRDSPMFIECVCRTNALFIFSYNFFSFHRFVYGRITNHKTNQKLDSFHEREIFKTLDLNRNIHFQ